MPTSFARGRLCGGAEGRGLVAYRLRSFAFLVLLCGPDGGTDRCVKTMTLRWGKPVCPRVYHTLIHARVPMATGSSSLPATWSVFPQILKTTKIVNK